jgi:hypothetical protein
MATNQTRFRTLDRVAADPRVREVYSDSDGIWVYFVPGWNFEGCSGIRGDTVRHVLEQFRDIEEGETY